MNNISFSRLLRFSITASIVLILIAFIFNVGIASANDVGTVTIQGASIRDDYTLDTGRVISPATISSNWNVIYFDQTSTNHLVDFKVVLHPVWTATNLTNSSFFSITTNGSGTGFISYDNKQANASEFALYYFFDNNAVFTQSPITITLEKNILSNIIIAPAQTSFCSQNDLSSVKPIGLYSGGGGGCGATRPMTSAVIYSRANVGTTTNNSYNVTYFNNSQAFSIEITKETIGTKVQLYDDFANIYFTEPNFNTNSTSYFNNTNRGLTLNITTSDGGQAIRVINHTPGFVSANTPTVGANGVGIVFDYDIYTPNTFANISWIRDHSIPFGSVDTIVLSPPSGINVVLVTNPASTGFIKNALSEIGNYKVMYNRTGLFGLGTPVTLDSSTAIVTNENPSYIIANATVPSGIAFNASYLFGYTPAIQGELNSIKIERIDLQDITYYSTISLNNTNIVANTQYNISLTISGLGTYKLSLFDISRGFIANTTVRTIEVPIPIQRNISRSYIMTDLATYFKGDNIEISYGIDNTNFTAYPEKYIRIIHSSGTNPETGRVLTTMQEDIINVEITEVSTWFKWFSGVNYVELHAKNSTTDILLANTSFTLAFIDSDGYGLEVSPSTLCTGGTVYIKTSSPNTTSVLLTVDVYQKNSNGNKILYYQTFVNGANRTRQLKLVFDGEYFFNLYDTSNASRFVKKVVVDSGNCEVVVTSTATPLTPEKAQGDVTNLLTNSFFWALILIVGMMIATGVEMRQRQADAMIPMVIVGFMGLAGFTLIGWVPAWITFSIILLLAVIFAWQRAKDANTGGG